MTPPGYGADNHEIGTALFLARFQGDHVKTAALEQELTKTQAVCAHAPNPERPERCWKCGVTPVPSLVQEPRPGPAKVRRAPLTIRKTGT